MIPMKCRRPAPRLRGPPSAPAADQAPPLRGILLCMHRAQPQAFTVGLRLRAGATRAYHGSVVTIHCTGLPSAQQPLVAAQPGERATPIRSLQPTSLLAAGLGLRLKDTGIMGINTIIRLVPRLLVAGAIKALLRALFLTLP